MIGMSVGMGIAVLAFWPTLILLIVWREWRLYWREVRAARDRLREGVPARQERAAVAVLRPRTGQVEPAPRLVPLADVVYLDGDRIGEPFRPGGMPKPVKRSRPSFPKDAA